MATKKLIYADDARSAILRADPKSAFCIDSIPVVDAVEVVHGWWEKASETMPIYMCSICKERNLFKNGNNVLSNYCPNCGAKMDGGNEDGTAQV